jgi:putative acetyltransferase
MRVVVDNLRGQEIAEFLEEHIRDMRSVSPPESKHALDLEGLRAPEITFWSVYDGVELVGCGALKEIDPLHGEIKSMRSARNRRGTGVGRFMLSHIITEGRKRGYGRLSLETGSMAFFLPARKLYERAGFSYCTPFGSYREDPNSVFMTLDLNLPNK